MILGPQPLHASHLVGHGQHVEVVLVVEGGVVLHVAVHIEPLGRPAVPAADRRRRRRRPGDGGQPVWTVKRLGEAIAGRSSGPFYV